MSEFQSSLDVLFHGQSFGPRNGFEPLRWQTEIKDAYKDSVGEYRRNHANNGSVGQHLYPFFAATAVGKTKASALLATSLFNQGLVSQMFFGCPNGIILEKTRDDYLRYFGIDLVPLRYKDHRHGIPRGYHGAIFTYHYLFKIWQNERRREHLPTMFAGASLGVLDEVHHLLERESWGLAVLAAFSRAPYVISMTGTPFNSKKGRFAFCTYEETSKTASTGLYKLRAEFNYSLGEAVAEGIVRKPHFIFTGRHEDGEVTKVRIPVPPDDTEREVTFEDKLDKVLSSLRLRGAVRYGSVPRRVLLKGALALCEEEGRRVIIFLGGDSMADTTATTDALKLLPSELIELGYTTDDFDVIVGGGKDRVTREKVEAFRRSSKRILICINMISEGVDIPEISAAIFLTAVTAKQTTIQRIGRALRLMDPHRTALIFMFADPANLEIAFEIESEIEAEEIHLQQRQGAERGKTAREPYRRAEAIGISGGHLSSSVFNGQEDPFAAFTELQRRLKAKNLPHTLLHAALELHGVTDVDGRG